MPASIEPADCPNTVTFFGSPPNRAMLAWIQLKTGVEATADEIRDFCRGKIAYFKVPQYVRFVDSFPQTVTKKVQKFLIREQEIRERGLEELARQETA